MKLYIVRDSYGLWLFKQKPTKYIFNGDKYLTKSDITYYLIDRNLFPEVTFENSPQEIELKLLEKL